MGEYGGGKEPFAFEKAMAGKENLMTRQPYCLPQKRRASPCALFRRSYIYGEVRLDQAGKERFHRIGRSPHVQQRKYCVHILFLRSVCWEKTGPERAYKVCRTGLFYWERDSDGLLLFLCHRLLKGWVQKRRYGNFTGHDSSSGNFHPNSTWHPK